jgi:hypothetical protein
VSTSCSSPQPREPYVCANAVHLARCQHPSPSVCGLPLFPFCFNFMLVGDGASRAKAQSCRLQPSERRAYLSELSGLASQHILSCRPAHRRRFSIFASVRDRELLRACGDRQVYFAVLLAKVLRACCSTGVKHRVGPWHQDTQTGYGCSTCQSRQGFVLAMRSRCQAQHPIRGKTVSPPPCTSRRHQPKRGAG